MLVLTGTRFGDLQVPEEQVFTFDEGLIGLPLLKRFCLIAAKEDSPFRWMQSLDEPSMAFLIADPNRYLEDYAPVMSDEQAAGLGLEIETPTLVYTTACIPPGRPEAMTLNLAGPLIFNLENRRAAQLVIEDEAYPTKFSAFAQAPLQQAA